MGFHLTEVPSFSPPNGLIDACTSMVDNFRARLSLRQQVIPRRIQDKLQDHMEPVGYLSA